MLMLSLILSFAGCGNDIGTKKNTDETGKEIKDLDDENLMSDKTQLETYISEELLELTIHMHFRNAYVYKDDWPVFNEAERLTNVRLKGVAPTSATDTKEVFNLLMVSGDLPDIVEGDGLRDEFIKYGMEGAFIPLEDLIAEHGPNIQKFIDEHPYVKTYSSGPDGHMYYIPYIPDGSVGQGYFIRKDWLDKLGLDVPKDVDGLYTVLKAFANEDPNGNGQKDELPFFSRHVNEVVRLTHFWGARTGLFVDEEGRVQHGFASEAFKEGMINVAQWYKEGLIDPEIYTRGSKARDIALGNNIGGMTHDWFGSTASYNTTLADTIEAFEFIAIAPPADVNGDVWEEYNRERVKADGWAITTANEHVVETIKYFDFWFTEEGRRLINYGIEGEQYDMIDGKPVFKSEVLNGDKSVQAQLWDIGGQVPIGFHQDFEYEIQTYNDVAAEGVKMYVDNNYVAEAFPLIAFNEEEQKLFNALSTNIETYMRETHQRWILGGESVEAGWDTYINRLNELGFQEYLAIHQSAYDRIK